MCLNPTYIRNTWFCPFPLGSKERGRFEKDRPLWFLHDTTSAFIPVPCGVCSECLQTRQMEYVQRCYMMAKYSWTLFGTLTYRNQALPVLEVGQYKLKYARVDDFQKFIKRLRLSQILPPFRYLAVTEYGSDENKTHRPHFHFLIFIPKPKNIDRNLEKIKGVEYANEVLKFIVSKNGWQRNYGDSFNPIYMPISEFIRRGNKRTYDCQYVNGDSQNVNFYVTKYVLKFSKYVKELQCALKLNLPEDEYLKVWKKVRPRTLTSIGLGVKLDYSVRLPFSDIDIDIDTDITQMIEYSSKDQFPSFFMGIRKQPLSQYFIQRLMTPQQRILFHNNRFEDGPFTDEVYDQNIYLDDFLNFHQKNIAKSDSFSQICQRLNENKY